MENIKRQTIESQITDLQTIEKTVDFESNNVVTMQLETLKRTHKENDIYGNPIRGIYHYQVIERITALCELNGLTYEVE